MRALYSLVSRVRAVCALGQAMVTFVRAGPLALAPMQLLVLGCGLCFLIAMLLPSAPSGGRRAIVLERLCGVMAAAAVIGLTVAGAVGFCVFLGRLALGV